MVRLTTVVFLLLPLLSFSQNSDLGNWWIYFGNKQLNKNWNWHHEAQYRNYNVVGDLEQLLLRTGIGRNLTENNNNLLLGYAFILSENYLDGTDQKNSISEHRLYQQFITRQTAGRVQLQHRYRFEQRFIEEDFRLRFRYFLAVNVPLNNPSMDDQTFYLSAYNEIFLHTDPAVFDRNRLYGGLGFRLNGRLRLEVGYMNQFFEQSGRDQANIILFLNL